MIENEKWFLPIQSKNNSKKLFDSRKLWSIFLMKLGELNEVEESEEA